MNATVARIVNLLFEDLQESEEVTALREEVMNNCQERYRDLREQGLAEDDAIGQVVESLRGMEEMLASYPKKPAEGKAPVNGFAREGVAGVRCLRAELKDADVRVEPSPDGVFHCEMEGAGAPTIHISREGDCLRIVQSTREDRPEADQNLGILERIFSHISLAIGNTSCRVRVQLPADVALEDAAVRAMSGSAVWDGVPVGSLEIRTASGDVEVYRTPCRNRLTLHSASGDLTVEEKTVCGSLSMETMSGDISWEGSAGELFCKTASGDVDTVGDFRTAELHSVSGDVDVEVRGGETRRILVKSVSGNVDVTLPEGVGADARTKSVSGSVSNRAARSAARMVDVEASTVSGDIDIE